MKTSTIHTLAASILLLTAMTIASRADTHGNVHSITGSGLVVVPADFFFPGSQGFASWTTVSAHQKADGAVEGSSILHIWFDSQPNPIILAADINCLTSDGATAFFSGVVTRSNDLSYSKPGDQLVGFVTDTNGNEPDIFWVGPSIFFLPPGGDCTAKPAMLQYPLTSGNFVVR